MKHSTLTSQSYGIVPFLIAACLFLICSCSKGSESAPAHRLVGVWSGVQDANDTPPSEPAEWSKVLGHEEPSYMQMLFLGDGTFVMGGLMMGHTLVEESRWEVLEETQDRLRIRTTSDSGKVDDSMVLHFESDDLIWMEPPGTSTQRMYLRRAEGIGPFPLLKQYESRL